MKKRFTLFLVLLFAGVACAGARTLYLSADIWESDNARFATYHWTDGGADGTFTPFMTKDEASGYYIAEISDESNRCIFVRFSGEAAEPAWDGNVWNQTDDLSIGEDNLFTITGWGEGFGAKCTGDWSTYDDGGGSTDPNPDPEPEPDPYVSSVPDACPDVMLQAFYWDSYSGGTHGDTKWTTLQQQSSEINAYFDLVWLPPSARASGVGYHPAQYSNQNSTWGTRSALETLIAAFHAGETRVVADIVINHAANASTWCDFYPNNFDEYGYFTPDASWICSTDEVNTEDSGACKGAATGSRDDGYGSEANYSAARDWDHNSEEVREMFRAYAKWMKNVIGYDGFRYDYCKGFHNSHIDDYNSAAEIYFSVMEYWDGSASTLWDRINDAGQNSLAFDFATKYTAFNNNLSKGSFAGMKGSGLLGAGHSKYAVTFVDNHDTYQRDDNEFCGKGKSMTSANKAKTIQANAFILSMPGIPCVFYPHWYAWKDEIGPMVLARKAVGVHSESTVTDEGDAGGYRATVVGTNGTLVLELGNKVSSSKFGYTKAASGTGYAIWTRVLTPVAPRLIVTPGACTYKTTSLSVEMRTVGGSEKATIYYTTDGTDPRTSTTRQTYSTPLTITDTVTVSAYAVTATTETPVQQHTYTYKAPQTTPIIVKFYKPASWAKVNLYAWLETEIWEWPGTEMTVQDGEGAYYYQFDAGITAVNFIFNNGSGVQTSDLWTDEDVCYTFADGAELLLEDCEKPMAIENVEEEAVPAPDTTQPMYNILGQRVSAEYQGVIIQNAHKYLQSN